MFFTKGFTIMQNAKSQEELTESDNWNKNYVADIENKVNELKDISFITGKISIISFFIAILSFPERSHNSSSPSLSVFFMGMSLFVGFIASSIGVIFSLRALYKSDDLNHLDNTNISRKNIFLALALNLAPFGIFLLASTGVLILIGN